MNFYVKTKIISHTWFFNLEIKFIGFRINSIQWNIESFFRQNLSQLFQIFAIFCSFYENIHRLDIMIFDVQNRFQINKFCAIFHRYFTDKTIFESLFIPTKFEWKKPLVSYREKKNKNFKNRIILRSSILAIFFKVS